MTLLIIATNWPAPNYSAAGMRMFQLIDFFIAEGYQITVGCTAEVVPEYPDYPNISLTKIQLNHSSFDVMVTEVNPKIVLFDRFMAEEQFGWRVASAVPNAIRILDTEDLHSLRKTRQVALKQGENFSVDKWLKNDITKREIASIYRCDLSLIISSFEMELLKNVIVNTSLLVYLPFMFKAIEEVKIKSWKPFSARKDNFIFLGFGGHAPNVDAVKYLKTNIWPLIRRQLPRAEVHIYGGHLPQQIQQLHNPKEGFLVKGWAKDAETVISNAKVLLAPIRFGAGLKGKLIDGMRFGTPSVTTKIGAEGMADNLNWNGVITDDAIEFANAAVKLFQDEAFWAACQAEGAKIINTKYDKYSLSNTLSSKLQILILQLEKHRNKNFIGGLLHHHTMASTKYMSKWIEEKEKLLR